MTDHEKLAFETSLNTKATVTRTEDKSERSALANTKLREIGSDINLIEGSEYLGSCAVHVYKPKGIVQYLHFQCQVGTMQNVPQVIADKALTDLKGALQELYSGSRQTKLSGW